MDMQLKASFKKELLAFFRTKRFLTLTIVILGISLLSPLLIVGMGSLMNSMSDIYDSVGMDISGLTDELSSSATLGVSSQISDVSGVGLLVFLLLINSFAGGEQKKRSIIIPQSSGLDSFNYLLPKFIVYPVAVFALSLLGTVAAGVVSSLVFDVNDIFWPLAIAGGATLGVYNMFFVCLHLALGTSTGKAGMSSAVCISASMLLSGFFSAIDATPAYNPFALNSAAGSLVLGAEPVANIVVGIVLALAIMAGVFFLALFVQKAKRIDNSGNEILI